MCGHGILLYGTLDMDVLIIEHLFYDFNPLHGTAL
jgi:hypothetical protein